MVSLKDLATLTSKRSSVLLKTHQCPYTKQCKTQNDLKDVVKIQKSKMTLLAYYPTDYLTVGEIQSQNLNILIHLA